jgi:hypothetical protein
MRRGHLHDIRISRRASTQTSYLAYRHLMRTLWVFPLLALCSCDPWGPSPQSRNRDSLDRAIAKQDWATARALLGDPNAKFSTAKSNFQLGMRHAATSSMGQVSRQAVESIFTDDVLRIIVVLDKNGDRAEARQIQYQALGVLSNAPISSALSP